MRPYPGRHFTLDQDAYNYRHSKERCIVECGFGIMATHWRVFYTRLARLPDNVSNVEQAAVVSHNMLQCDTTPATDVEDLLTDK